MSLRSSECNCSTRRSATFLERPATIASLAAAPTFSEGSTTASRSARDARSSFMARSIRTAKERTLGSGSRNRKATASRASTVGSRLAAFSAWSRTLADG